MMHKARRSTEEVPYWFLRSSIKFQSHRGWKINDLNPLWVRLLGWSQLSNSSDLPFLHMSIPCQMLIDCQTYEIKINNSFDYLFIQIPLWDKFLNILLFVVKNHKFCFLAATKQLYEWFSPSVHLSVCPSHLFDYVPVIVSSWNFQEWLPVTKLMSMQKFNVRGQRWRSQRSKPNLSISGL